MKDTKSKYIFLTGGVVSSLGKGIAAAAIGALLEARGLTVTIQKLDPYINVDPGTLSPFQHGEVFVTDDGAETDLDLGHYERFTNIKTTQANNFTTGRIYNSVIQKERQGEYLGETVQVVPHITNEIKSAIKSATNDKNTITIVEIGGTIGDIESLPFLEAIRQMRNDEGRENVLYIHLTLVPYIKSANELKTKPTQHSVKELRSIGIQPDILLCRSEIPLPFEHKKKIALHCDIDINSVISAIDVKTIYQVPIALHEECLDNIIVDKFDLPTIEPNIVKWHDVVTRITKPKVEVNIAIVGKYVGLRDSYMSLLEALTHGGIANYAKVNFQWVDAEEIEVNGTERLISGVDGILVPGGFGKRGIEGKILAVKYAREKEIPFFGICLGMHCAVIEFARNVCGLEHANSVEFDENTSNPVIYMIEKWYNYRSGIIQKRSDKNIKGGTMRLGEYPCDLIKDSQVYQAYKVNKIFERHRHRYEFNDSYRKLMEQQGMMISGYTLVEMIELKNHPWFVGCQFHPEFKSRPTNSHPLFKAFIKASLNNKKKYEDGI